MVIGPLVRWTWIGGPSARRLGASATARPAISSSPRPIAPKDGRPGKKLGQIYELVRSRQRQPSYKPPLTRRFAPPSPRFAGRGFSRVPSPRLRGEGRVRGV